MQAPTSGSSILSVSDSLNVVPVMTPTSASEPPMPAPCPMPHLLGQFYIVSPAHQYVQRAIISMQHWADGDNRITMPTAFWRTVRDFYNPPRPIRPVVAPPSFDFKFAYKFFSADCEIIVPDDYAFKSLVCDGAGTFVISNDDSKAKISDNGRLQAITVTFVKASDL
jgi:hypothetical protein